jgi:hypothetical protein
MVLLRRKNIPKFTDIAEISGGIFLAITCPLGGC